MSLSRPGAVVAAAALCGLATFGFQAPANAQYGPGQGPGNQTGQGQPTDSTPNRGQQIGVSTDPGSFDPGSTVNYGLDCGDGVQRGTGSTVVGSDGSADFQYTVPSDAPEGSCTLVLTGTLNGAVSVVNVEVDVQGGGTGGTGGTGGNDNGSALPRTGSQEIVPLTAAGIALVLGGAAIVVVARRRRDDIAGSSNLA